MNENKGERFTYGWIGGAVSGFIQSGASEILMLGGPIMGGIGSFFGTMITESLNNIDKPDENKKTLEQISVNSVKAFVASSIMNTICLDFSEASNIGSIYSELYGEPLSDVFVTMGNLVFNELDDIAAYIFVDVL